MAKLVLLLSLLSAIIGWSEAGLYDAETQLWAGVEEDVCGFLLDRGAPPPRHELKTEKKNEEPGEVLLEFKEAVQHSNQTLLRIQFVCDPATNSKIVDHGKLEHTVAFDLYLKDGIPYARVQYLNDLTQPTEYIITQSGDFGPAAYDVSGYLGFYTFIIPSNLLLTGESENNSAQQHGYWLRESEEVFMSFGGLGSKTIRYLELPVPQGRNAGKLQEKHKNYVRFEYHSVTRTHTTVAFLHKSGTISVFPVPLIDATTTVIKCEKMETDWWWAIVLSGQDPLDGRVFLDRMRFQSGDHPNFHLTVDKVTYGSPPLPNGSPPLPNGSLPLPNGSLPLPNGSLPLPNGSLPLPPPVRSHRRQNRGKKGGSSRQKRNIFFA